MNRISLIFFFATISSQLVALDLTYQPITAGLDYARLSLTNPPRSIHVARLDRSRKDFRLVTTHAHDVITALSPVSQQVKLLPAKGFEPLAAINGDFFAIKPGPFQGDPDGLQILDGEVISLPRQSCFWVDRHGCHIDSVEARCRVIWPEGAASLLQLNELPGKNSVVLFTTRFGESIRTTNGISLRVTMPKNIPFPPLRAEGEYQVQVRDLYTNLNCRINNGEAVLLVTGPETNSLAFVRKGSLLEIDTYFAPSLRRVNTAIGGGPVLVHQGTNQHADRPAHPRFAETARNPRTAVGFNARYLFLVEVDGRQPALSVGMTFAELGAVMRDLGCTEALNLDGGGSSTFWLGGEVKNSPSDKHERGVANALVIARPLDKRE